MKTNLQTLYRLLALLGLGLSVGPQSARAELVSVNSITNSATTIGVYFDPPVTSFSATNLANYTVLMNTGAVSVVDATLQTNGQFVALTLATPIGEFFSVSASNVVGVTSATNHATVLGYISDYSSDDVGVLGDPDPAGQVFTAHGDSFEVTVGGSDIGGVSDAFHFIYEPIVGDFDMTTLVTRLDLADPESKAGLMARESMAPDSASLQTFFTPTAGSNDVQVAVRATTGGATTDAGFQIGARASATPLRWLRLSRTNDTFTAYQGISGSNGVIWAVSGVTTQAFATNLLVGMAVTAHTFGIPTTADFSDFEISGARPGDTILPTVTAALAGTNLTLNWLRTPRDFAVEASTNLTDWALFLLPIIEGVTNSNQRSMQIPLALATNHLYLRLIRVKRLIPDPPLLLTTGIILSPDCYGLSPTTSAGSLCTYAVRAAYAYAQTSGLIIAPKGTLVTFTTFDSDQTVDTVLQVNNAAGASTCNDNVATGNYKSKVLQTATANNLENAFSFVVAPKKNPPTGYASTGVIRVTITY